MDERAIIWLIFACLIYVAYFDFLRPYARQFSKTLGARSARRLLPDPPKKLASPRKPKATTKKDSQKQR